jgi:pseudaminic acid synthase
LYREAYTPWEWQPKLKEIAENAGLAFFSTPFDFTAVDFLETMDIGFYKVASFELVDIPLLEKIGATEKPVIMSTGMGTLAEIEEAVSTLKQNGCPAIALLRCVSAYPAPEAEMNLKTIPHLSSTFDVVSGLSDHSLGIVAPVTAVSLGASIIEKHFTLSKKDKGPDSGFSLDKQEFRAMVEAIRSCEQALGSVNYGRTEKEEASLRFRKSLFVSQNIRKGEKYTRENLRSVRPADGLHPRYYREILGCSAGSDVKKGTPLDWHMIAR